LRAQRTSQVSDTAELAWRADSPKQGLAVAFERAHTYPLFRCVDHKKINAHTANPMFERLQPAQAIRLRSKEKNTSFDAPA